VSQFFFIIPFLFAICNNTFSKQEEKKKKKKREKKEKRKKKKRMSFEREVPPIKKPLLPFSRKHMNPALLGPFQYLKTETEPASQTSQLYIEDGDDAINTIRVSVQYHFITPSSQAFNLLFHDVSGTNSFNWSRPSRFHLKK
jgi:hypothetical protein